MLAQVEAGYKPTGRQGQANCLAARRYLLNAAATGATQACLLEAAIGYERAEPIVTADGGGIQGREGRDQRAQAQPSGP